VTLFKLRKNRSRTQARKEETEAVGSLRSRAINRRMISPYCVSVVFLFSFRFPSTGPPRTHHKQHDTNTSVKYLTPRPQIYQIWKDCSSGNTGLWDSVKLETMKFRKIWFKIPGNTLSDALPHLKRELRLIPQNFSLWRHVSVFLSLSFLAHSPANARPLSLSLTYNTRGWKRTGVGKVGEGISFPSPLYA